MKRSTLMTRSAIFAALGASFALAACNQNSSSQSASSASSTPPPAAALPLTTSAAQPVVDAPPATQLPTAPRARVVRLSNPHDSYAYVDQASSMSYGLGDAPPDYTFDYNGSRPWVWRSSDNSVRVVERLSGGDRYYYYRPGSDYPYLVRDPDYTYGYDDGALVVVYDHSGRALPPDYVDQRADIAGRYLARAKDIYYASQQRQRESVAAANWQARQSELDAENARWRDQQNQYPDWRSYHDQHDADDHAHWDQERYSREAEAALVAAQLFNNQQAASRYQQEAQRARDDAHARGQNFGGGGNFGGGNGQGQPFARQDNQGQPPGQFGPQGNGFDPHQHDHDGHNNGGPPPQGQFQGQQGGQNDAAQRAAMEQQHQAQMQAQNQAHQADLAQQQAHQHQQEAQQQAQQAQRDAAARQADQAQQQAHNRQQQAQDQAMHAQQDAEHHAQLAQQHDAQARAQNQAQQAQQAQHDAERHAADAQQHQAQAHAAQEQAHQQAAEAHPQAAPNYGPRWAMINKNQSPKPEAKPEAAKPKPAGDEHDHRPPGAPQ